VDQNDRPAREPSDDRGRRRPLLDLRSAVGAAVVGGDAALRLVAIALIAEGHALLEDVPGTGKTLLARAFARALTLETNRVQGTPDLLPSDITGSSIFEAGSLRFAPGRSSRTSSSSMRSTGRRRGPRRPCSRRCRSAR